MIEAVPTLAQSPPPAAGAELAQVLVASGAAVVLTVALLVLGLGHRSGRIGLLGGLADRAERISGLPGWAALPTLIAAIALVLAVFGMYWDISLHIDNGRDPGPLANPSHYFILAGLFGIFAAGWLAIVLPRGRPGPAAIQLGPDWYAPVSGIMMTACSAFALLGFPLDDVSHRLFGQDVTLWGPTHLMLLTGAGLTLIAILALLTEARLAAPGAGAAVGRLSGPAALIRSRRARVIMAFGGLLVGLSVYQGEFDFGVPQFRLLFDPVLISFAAGTALVAARLVGGRGAALGAVGFFLLVRGGLALIVGPGLGETTPMLPLYLLSGLLVEAVAVRAPVDRPYRFALISGALIGSLGVVSEWAWSQLAMPIPWPAQILPEAIALSIPVALAAAVLGAFLAGGLMLRPALTAAPRGLAAALASLLVLAGTATYLLITTVPDGARATVSLSEVSPGPPRQVEATIRFDLPALAEDADWLNVTAWQGGDRLVVAPLEPIGGGEYRTTDPIPVSGEWKAGVRLHRGDVLATVPIYTPEDSAIPVAGIPAKASFDRALVADRDFLQRERKDDVPGWIWGAAGVVVAACTVTLLLLLGWGLRRLARRGPRAPLPTAESLRARPRQQVAAPNAGITS